MFLSDCHGHEQDVVHPLIVTQRPIEDIDGQHRVNGEQEKGVQAAPGVHLKIAHGDARQHDQKK